MIVANDWDDGSRPCVLLRRNRGGEWLMLNFTTRPRRANGPNLLLLHSDLVGVDAGRTSYVRPYVRKAYEDQVEHVCGWLHPIDAWRIVVQMRLRDSRMVMDLLVNAALHH